MKNSLIKKLKKELDKVNNLEDWKQLKAKYISKSEYLEGLKTKLKESSDKKNVGLKIKDYLENVNILFAIKKNELENAFFLEEKENILLKDYDENNRVALSRKEGTIHPLTKLTFLVYDSFTKMGFSYVSGQEIESEKYNFDILNLGKNHPAREKHDTLYLEDENLLLRTHSTNMTARVIEKETNLPILSFTIGPVFRNDESDSTHSLEFNQIDFFTLSNSATITNLKYVVNTLLKNIFNNQDMGIRYRPSYFPFTEPSYEVDIECFNCKNENENEGCNICKSSKWIEILGSGMLNPNVLKKSKAYSDKLSGIAGGIGLERIAMLKWNIKDIRNFYINDLQFLRSIGEEK